MRIFGNDGEIKGALKHIEYNQFYSVEQLLELPEVDLVLDIHTKNVLDPHVKIHMGGRTKTVIYQHKSIFFAFKEDGIYKSLSKSKLRELGEQLYD